MRGQKIFNDVIKDAGIARGMRKGRNNSLIFKRNDCLIARYYYYASVKNKTYEDTLRQIMSEFFLSPVTVALIVQQHTEELQALKQKAPVLYYFQNKWPHLKW